METFDETGILIGWMCDTNMRGGTIKVFIPRRDEDVEEDRAAIAALFRKARSL